ncbi:glycosyltransferase family 2 protein [Marilutibacter alkalisoli]|uniref:glycosyltransferase family 2 protein n=1 Tax=Marilutibacter alkalisoli TaxID=2591633 RepID=UPI001FC8EE8C|nr:glycosyltransferase family 2 protein [Lysobacter alkalisoli]
MRWEVVARAGEPPVAVELWPDAFLEPIDGEDGPEWRSRGERSGFGTKGSFALPAGWYEVSGQLNSTDESTLVPCLYLAYVPGSDGDHQILLPDPDRNGRVRALVLLKYDVTGLRFSPGSGILRFRMGRFGICRLTRANALWKMLVPLEGEGSGLARALARGGRFLSDCLGAGVSTATARLFSSYRKRLHPRELGDYEGWVLRFDTLGSAMIGELGDRVARLGPVKPLISVLLPTYQTPERWLRKCIESVQAQVYPNWQLCIADDASSDPKVMEVIREYAGSDPRIVAVRRESNGHISEASNSALEMASGDFVALLDHDDELRPHALLEMAEAIMEAPDIGLLYSDEDKIDAEGRRFDPYFKPDWDPDLLRSQNYVCHLTVIRTELVRAVGGFRKGFEGSQDHDLILRCTECLLPSQIRHIPKVLYHWRAIPGSTALTRDAKDYAATAGVRAVDEQLSRSGTGARAEELSHGHYRVRWPLPSPRPKVSLVVPTRDKAGLLRLCIDSILQRSTYRDFEIVVVDNGSSEPDAVEYLESLRGVDQVRVLRYDAPFNYSAINNWAIAQCDGEVIGLVNNDIEVITPDWLEEMVSHAIRPDVGAVGAMLYYPNDTIQHAGVILGVHGVAAHAYAGMVKGYPGHGGRVRVAQGLSAVTGACLLVKRERFEQLGGLDETLAVAFNDIDFCLRLREAGYRNVWTPFAELYHHESASRGSEDTEAKKKRFSGEVQFMMNRWDGMLLRDPAYNPNLSLQDLNFALSFPPRNADGRRDIAP